MVVILLVGFGLRVAAVGWGLPYVDHHDEPSAANAALGMLRRGDWNPEFFQKPSLYYYALRLVFAAHWQYGLATGLYTTLDTLPQGTYYYMAAPGFFVWGRVFSAVLGTATLGVVYLLGRRWWGATVGVLAALFLAVMPFHIRHSQLLTVDALNTLMALLALWASLEVGADGRRRRYTIAGILIGLAAGTKYPSAAIALVLVVTHMIHWKGVALRQVARLGWAAVCSCASFVLATPYVLITPQRVLSEIVEQYVKYGYRSTGDIGTTPAIIAYPAFFWSMALLPALCLLVLIGIAVVLRRRDHVGITMLAFVSFLVVFFMVQREHFFRNLLPTLPLLALFGGVAVVVIMQRARQVRVVAGSWMGGLLGVVIVLPLLWNALAQDWVYTRPHAKVLAGDYVRTHLPRGAPLALALNPLDWRNQPMVTIIDDLTRHDANWYRAQGYRYLVGNVRTNPEHYQAFQQQTTVIAAFDGEYDGELTPSMEVLDLGQHNDDLAITHTEATFGDQLRLLGFQSAAGDLRAAFSPLGQKTTVRAGKALQLNVYWEALHDLPIDYTVFVHLLDAQNKNVAQRDTLIRGYDYPTSHWQVGELAVDLADLAIPEQLAPGPYQLEIGVYNAQTLQRLPVPGQTNAALILTTVQVTQ